MAPPPLCECGTCTRCKRRVYMRRYYRKKSVPVIATCRKCGASYPSSKRKVEAGRSAYCSESCKNSYSNGQRTAALRSEKRGRCCQHCGKAIPSHMRADKKWCSASCATKASRLRNPEMRHRSNLKQYGVTVEEYREMLAAQDHGCAICGSPGTPKKRLSVDHCHETGRVRGLLCDECNLGIGQFKHDTKRLAAAISYLS